MEAANKSKDSAKQKADGISRHLDDKEAMLRKYEMEKIELETKFHTLSRSKDELRSKVTELSSKVERKEREVREVTDRYKMYVMELESKLDQDTDAKHNLQLEIDQLKSDLSSAAVVSSEAAELREVVDSLEKAVGTYRGKVRDADTKTKEIEEKLASATDSKEEIERTLKKVNGEKAEVIAALEGVINEVQNREDEIESLSELLNRRDEELEHAKIIATKALQSAKDIQKRYKDKEKDRQNDMLESMEELNDKVEVLTSKNDTLQRKISMLERDLRDRNLECKRLKDQLRQVDGKQLHDDFSRMKDDASAFTQETAVGTSRSFSNVASSGSMSGIGLRIQAGEDPPEGLATGTDSFSPSVSPTSPADVFGREDRFDEDVVDSDDGALSTIVTNEEYDDESSGGLDSMPSVKSRRTIERDALRKYVRQRYMSQREKA